MPDETKHELPGFDPAVDVVLDARSLHGLAHPLRLRLRAELVEHGPATATQLAARTGESSGATSYHLRQLATYGFVVDEPSRGKGRERYWRAVHRSSWFDMSLSELPARELGVEYLRAVARLYADRIVRFAGSIGVFREELGGRWDDAWNMSDWILDLNPEEAAELGRRFHELCLPYRQASDRPRAGRRRVVVQFQIMPTAEESGECLRDRRGVAGLLGAVGASLLGKRMSFLALPWFVLTTTGSATRTGLVAFAEMGPYVGVQALGGPLVDRLGARRVSIVTDLLAAIFVGAVPVLGGIHVLSIPLLAALVAMAGAVRGAGDSARDVLVPGVGELAQMPLERSSGLYDGVNRLATLVGAPLAGVLVLATSALSVLALDAGTFAVSALLVAWLVPRAAQPPGGHGEAAAAEASYLASLGEGFRYLLQDRLLLAIAAMVLVTNFVDQAGGTVFFPVWAHSVAHSSVALGLLGGAFALGAVAGNALTTWLGPTLPRRMTYAVGFLVAGAPRYIAVALAASVSPVLAVMFLGGLGAGGINPILGAVEYERVPRHLQARVLGAVGASAWAGIPIGSLAGGLAVAGFGLRPALVAAAAVYGLTTLVPFVFPAWRQMERPQASCSGAGKADCSCREQLRASVRALSTGARAAVGRPAFPAYGLCRGTDQRAPGRAA